MVSTAIDPTCCASTEGAGVLLVLSRLVLSRVLLLLNLQWRSGMHFRRQSNVCIGCTRPHLHARQSGLAPACRMCYECVEQACSALEGSAESSARKVPRVNSTALRRVTSREDAAMEFHAKTSACSVEYLHRLCCSECHFSTCLLRLLGSS